MRPNPSWSLRRIADWYQESRINLFYAPMSPHSVFAHVLIFFPFYQQGYRFSARPIPETHRKRKQGGRRMDKKNKQDQHKEDQGPRRVFFSFEVHLPYKPVIFSVLTISSASTMVISGKRHSRPVCPRKKKRAVKEIIVQRMLLQPVWACPWKAF